MLESIKQLYSAPFNKIYPFFAIYRFTLWKFIRIFRVRNYSYSLWENKKIILNYNNHQSSWIMYNYWVDWEEFNLIKDIIQSDDIVFEIGANMGFYTIWMSKFISNSGRIHSFEPDEKSYSRLIENIRVNHIQGYVISNKVAIADEVKLVKFTKGMDGENHILNKTGPDYEILPCTTIDQYVVDHTISKIKYLKIDIEGFELHALLGANKTLKSGKIDILQLEINSQIQNSGSTINGLLTYIEEVGYRLCSYDPEYKKLFPINYSTTRENYFMVKNQLIEH